MNTLLRTSLSIFAFLPAFICAAQPAPLDCQCDHLIDKPGIYRPKSQGTGLYFLDVQPGQTICIKAGHYDNMRFFNFQGAAGAPIKVINCGGKVTLSNSGYSAGLVFENCRYFHVTGSGDDTLEYGISIDGTPPGASGVVVTRFSSDFEIDHIEVKNTGFAGMMIKTDPGCNPATWQENFTMFDINVHHNYIHDTGAEGLYVGNSFWNYGMQVNCSGQIITVYPHEIFGLEIHHNIIENTGADGLQYGCAPDAEVYSNIVANTGVSPFATSQNSGIQCSGGAGGNCYNNVVREAGGTGIIVLGHLGGNHFFNNLIVNSGGYGFFVNDFPGTMPGSEFVFINNTIVNAGTDGMRFYNETNVNTVKNNAIVGTGTGRYIYYLQGATANTAANFTAANLEDAQFEDLENFRPQAASPLVDSGSDVAMFGLNFDLDELPRPVHAAYDIGAYEMQSNQPALKTPVLLNEFDVVYSSRQLQIASQTNGARCLVRICDAAGRVVLSDNFEMEYARDLSLLMPGIYYVTCSQNSRATMTRKLVLN